MKTLTSVGGMASRLVTRLAAPTTTTAGSGSGSGGRDHGGDDYAMESSAETNPLVLNREVSNTGDVVLAACTTKLLLLWELKLYHIVFHSITVYFNCYCMLF